MKLNKTLQSTTISRFKDVLREPPVQNMDFLIDKTQTWVQRIRLSKTIFAAADIIQSDGEFGPIPGMVEDSLNINFDTSIGLDYSESIQERLEYYKSREAFTSTGLSNLDKTLGGGIRPGSLFIYIGPTHTGKCFSFSEEIDIYVTDDELKKIEDSVFNKNLYAFAMPRGEGKTTLCRVAVIWASIYGHCRYIYFFYAIISKNIKILIVRR